MIRSASLPFPTGHGAGAKRAAAPLIHAAPKIVSLSAALLLVTAPTAAAQNNPAHASSAGLDAPGANDAERGDEPAMIVVTADRRGEALVAAQTELGEEDIGIYGADSIRQLLERIAPEIDGSGELPELVINGKRVDPAAIRAFPPEALARLAILSPEAAARYGFDPGKRVVNLVLKENYASWNAVASALAATRGGRRGARLNAGRFLIAGDLRWNMQGAASYDGRLLKSDRDLPDQPKDQWAVAAGLEPQRYETLLPSSSSLSLNSGITHPLGDFSGTANLNFTAAGGEGLLGLVPEEESEIGRPEPLRSTSAVRTLGFRASMSGRVSDWRTQAALNIVQSWNENRFDRPSSTIGDRGRLTDRTQGFSRTASLDLEARKNILALPAGPAGMVLSLRGVSSRTTRTSGDGSSDDFNAAQRQVSAGATLAVPVASRTLDIMQPLGDLSVDIGTSADKVANSPLRWRWNAGGTWSPVESLRLRASYEYEQRLPTFDQLSAPLVETVSRVFDFARQEVAEVIWITGGNPALRDGNGQRLSIDAMVRPLGNELLTLNLNYRRERKVGGITALPELTPAVEAAFPDRFIRDADGQLIAVDARPINIESETRAQLTSGAAIRWSGRGDRPLRLNMSFSHRWRLEDILVTGGGIAPIDRLEEGASPRHSATMQIVAARSGLGLTLNGTWSGEAQVGGGAGFRYAPTLLLNLEIYAEPEDLWADQEAWAKDLKISLDVQNLLDGYRRVTKGGALAPGFERDLIDPLGRTVRLTATKTF